MFVLVFVLGIMHHGVCSLLSLTLADLILFYFSNFIAGKCQRFCSCAVGNVGHAVSRPRFLQNAGIYLFYL